MSQQKKIIHEKEKLKTQIEKLHQNLRDLSSKQQQDACNIAYHPPVAKKKRSRSHYSRNTNITTRNKRQLYATPTNSSVMYTPSSKHHKSGAKSSANMRSIARERIMNDARAKILKRHRLVLPRDSNTPPNATPVSAKPTSSSEETDISSSHSILGECVFFSTRGVCRKGEGCRFIHDTSKVEPIAYHYPVSTVADGGSLSADEYVPFVSGGESDHHDLVNIEESVRLHTDDEAYHSNSSSSSRETSVDICSANSVLQGSDGKPTSSNFQSLRCKYVPKCLLDNHSV
mmetsp:Transcript_13567/g.20361  ORF Transcript_13567/g.20361 Transcript_13567/m.20361 type:complete len:287 (+) Transcript_13567:72-932(+)